MAHTWCMYINAHKSLKTNVFKRKLTNSNRIKALSQSREEGSCLSGALFLHVRESSSKNSWALCWEWGRIFTLPVIWPVYIYNPTSKTINKPIKDPSVLFCVKIIEMAYITKRHEPTNLTKCKTSGSLKDLVSKSKATSERRYPMPTYSDHMHMCVYTLTHTCTHTHICAYTHIHTHTKTHAYIHILYAQRISNIWS